jgi:predicted nucleic acid-binding Zn ribbon protein
VSPRPRSYRDPESIGKLVQQVLGDLGLDAPARVIRLAERWEEAVGPEIADHCIPISLRGGVLEARVESSVWSQQLQPRRPEILAGLRRVFGEEAPTDVRFRVG